MYAFLNILPLEFLLPLISVLLLPGISSFSGGLFSLPSADFAYLLNIVVPHLTY